MIQTRPPVPTLTEEVDFALAAMRAAAELMAVMARSPSGAMKKEDWTPVTAMDFAIQAALRGLLERWFPTAVMVAEEASQRLRREAARGWRDEIVAAVRQVHPDATEDKVLDWVDSCDGDPEPRFWALDPVDGTKGLLRGGQFATALTLIDGGRPIVGALACPRYDRFRDGGCLAFAVRGGGAWAAPIDGSEWTRLGVSSTADPSGAVLLRSVESDFLTNRKLTKIRRALGMTAAEVRMDSQVKYLGLASSEGDLIVRLPRRGGGRENIWDHAAGVLLVDEAGGRASDLSGEPLDFGAGRMMVRNLGVLASNGPLHEAALEALRRVALTPGPSPARRERGVG